MAQVVCKFNGECQFQGVQCNSKHFVDALLTEVGIDPNTLNSLSGLVLNGYKKVFNYPSDLLEFCEQATPSQIDKHYLSYYQMESIPFESRIELSKFAFWLNSIQYFHNSRQGLIHYKVLKAYDRALLLRDRGIPGFTYPTDVPCFFTQSHSFEGNESITKIEFNFGNLFTVRLLR